MKRQRATHADPAAIRSMLTEDGGVIDRRERGNPAMVFEPLVAITAKAIAKATNC